MEDILIASGIILMLASAIALKTQKKSSYDGSRIEAYEKNEKYDRELLSEDIDIDEEEMDFLKEIEYIREPKEDCSEEVLNIEEDEAREKSDYKKAISYLYLEGYSTSDIAKKLSIGKHEVEIILKIKQLMK